MLSKTHDLGDCNMQMCDIKCATSTLIGTKRSIEKGLSVIGLLHPKIKYFANIERQKRLVPKKNLIGTIFDACCEPASSATNTILIYWSCMQTSVSFALNVRAFICASFSSNSTQTGIRPGFRMARPEPAALQRLVFRSLPVVSYPDIWPVQIKQRGQRLFPPAAS